MLTTIEFPVERWFDSDWPTTTQTIENAHTMAPACLVGLTGVAFIIWGGPNHERTIRRRQSFHETASDSYRHPRLILHALGAVRRGRYRPCELLRG
ncbi:hypothetical protein BAURA86_02954 [Brevibacterium aurantiacum]|uniref:Uncharacterized protein n=1 Tax=Brevibacterium aurantiacum TaxID=273384 RepID=A0A2H1KLD5_BREAU|nr:hypothetical protein BAURA86_02954 [Brevibacterium aurantiacum]